MGVILQDFGAYELWKIERQDLADFTKFVLRIYYEHHLNISPPVEEVEACIKEDEGLYPHTHFYALKNKDGQIFGTINVCLWNQKETLAIEREYSLDIKQLIKERALNPPEIWHIGRFAIDRKIINQTKALKAQQAVYFKLLLTCAISHTIAYHNNIIIAECDAKLHEILIKLNVLSETLNEGHFVLGSQALPIMDTGAGLQDFFDKHKHLINHV